MGGGYGELLRLQRQHQQRHLPQQSMSAIANPQMLNNQATSPASAVVSQTTNASIVDPQFFSFSGQHHSGSTAQHQALLIQAAAMLPNPILQQGLQMPPGIIQPSHNLVNAGFQRFPSPMLNQNIQASLGSLFPGSAASFFQATTLQSSFLSGRKPTLLYMSCDDESLSPYQCLVRKQIELFEADRQEVENNAKGRNKPIVMGQVGIRCRHCAMLHNKARDRGSKYYPAKLNGLYQAAQSMASGHLCYHCKQVPQSLRNELLILREKKSSAGGGKKYWGDGVCVLGVVEDENGLRFK